MPVENLLQRDWELLGLDISQKPQAPRIYSDIRFLVPSYLASHTQHGAIPAKDDEKIDSSSERSGVGEVLAIKTGKARRGCIEKNLVTQVLDEA